MEAFESLVKRLVACFGDAGLDYMLTRALAASYYGNARTTTDADVVVAITNEKEKAELARALRKAGLRAEEKQIDNALQSDYRIARFKDKASPVTVDVILADKKLEKKAGSVLGLSTFYQTPEDLILAKLRMIRATVPRERALKDEEDVRAILRFTKVDTQKVERQAEKDGTLAILKELLA